MLSRFTFDLKVGIDGVFDVGLIPGVDVYVHHHDTQVFVVVVGTVPGVVAIYRYQQT